MSYEMSLWDGCGKILIGQVSSEGGITAALSKLPGLGRAFKKTTNVSKVILIQDKLNGLEASVKEEKGRWIHLPPSSFEPENIKEILRLVDEIVADLESGKTVQFCEGGRLKQTGRLLTCIALRHFNSFLSEAMDKVSQKAPEKLGIEADPEFIREFQKNIRQREILGLVEIPLFDFPGKIYRGKMPDSRDQFEVPLRDQGIDHIVMLQEQREFRFLKHVYEAYGIKVTHFPIPSFSIPDPKKLEKLLKTIEEKAKEGKNTEIHCTRGNGRTGLVLACLAKKTRKITGEEAIKQVRHFLPKAVETLQQEQFVKEFGEKAPNHQIRASGPRPAQFQAWEGRASGLKFTEIESFEGNFLGKVYRSPMPKPIKATEEALRKNGVSHIVLLNEEKEYGVAKLIEFYRKIGMEITHFPIKDFSTPDPADLSGLISTMSEKLDDGIHTLVHCRGGIGRTGLVLACLAKKALNLDGQKAIDEIRKYVPHAIETPEQEKFVKEFLPMLLLPPPLPPADWQPKVNFPPPRTASLNLTEMTFFKFPGKIYRGAMPFNTEGLDDALKEKGIDHIVLLQEEREYQRIDLKQAYEESGVEVTHFPIKDFSIPDSTKLSGLIDTMIEKAKEGKNTEVHCMGGRGRTGLVLACLAKRALDLGGKAAIQEVRRLIPGAVETDQQIKFVDKFEEEADESSDTTEEIETDASSEVEEYNEVLHWKALNEIED